MGKWEEIKLQMERKQDLELVTIIQKKGSAPRGAGAYMLVDKRGRITGTIGGGTLEYEAEKAALYLLSEKDSQVRHFSLNHQEAANIGMVCGGEAEILFLYLEGGTEGKNGGLAAALENIEHPRTGFFIVELTGGMVGEPKAVPCLPDCLMGLSLQEGIIEGEGRTFYVERICPGSRVLIFGGGHVAQKLVPLLAGIDFSCVVVDDREEFTRKELFPQAERVICTGFDQISEKISITGEDYIVIMTRGHQWDTQIQEQVLRSPAAYIGVMGSRRKKEYVQDILRKKGFREEEILRVKTPIGLDIGADTPEEIAISIGAELIHVRAMRREG